MSYVKILVGATGSGEQVADFGRVKPYTWVTIKCKATDGEVDANIKILDGESVLREYHVTKSTPVHDAFELGKQTVKVVHEVTKGVIQFVRLI